MILGLGLDLFDVARMERELSRLGQDLLDELFTSPELDACASRRKPARGYAALYAAKEAVFKALGTGKVGHMAWRDIEVTGVPGPEGPGLRSMRVRLSGETARVARESGVSTVLVSLAHTRESAIAWVVVTGQ